jgi:hypothetical protein
LRLDNNQANASSHITQEGHQLFWAMYFTVDIMREDYVPATMQRLNVTVDFEESYRYVLDSGGQASGRFLYLGRCFGYLESEGITGSSFRAQNKGFAKDIGVGTCAADHLVDYTQIEVRTGKPIDLRLRLNASIYTLEPRMFYRWQVAGVFENFIQLQNDAQTPEPGTLAAVGLGIAAIIRQKRKSP